MAEMVYKDQKKTCRFDIKEINCLEGWWRVICAPESCENSSKRFLLWQ